ncbi:heavy metal sensor histidine kinase [Paraburkholderia sp. MMS20-SJTR3]|uniref:Sensor protein n=1 Tax=Paraburkholderia sejongensis TaxID=2886946 RepID=A0ABS8JRB0_9BURK|nr:heavy metal sensor histidine kinase [Paraburkholderia sp. MMS20-SJTR3]MCC8392434.1 heavy metal sensor histidine kinase [Paraburkholderia sp. MMS20-SJTR3]
MALRSLTTGLALSFAGTTLAVFALVGSTLYFTLDREVKQQDDLDIVLIARHTRRLAEELHDEQDVREHADRLTSQVLGHSALSMAVLGANGAQLIEHNTAGIADPAFPQTPLARRLGPAQRIAEADVVGWRSARGVPVRGLATEAALTDGTPVTIVIARDMTDRWLLLDRYRERLYGFGFAGMLLAFLMSWLLVRAALRPLREIAASAATITVDRLGTPIEMKRAPSELVELATALNAMLERLHGGFERMSQYTADLAHDMRTPLGNLRGATEVALVRPRSPAEYEALLESNLEECDRLSRMIESVIFLARAEHPQFLTTLEEFDAHAALGQIADYFEGLADDAGVTIRVQGEGRLRADKELVRRALSNLLANALRYTPRGGAIVLSVEQTPAALELSVFNPGPPIDPALLERIFDRFYRADASRHNEARAGASAGLGLAIVRTIMALHGGSARAESDATGTRFILRFARP